ncbi:MAG: nucleotidyl transferase AbiEii/AbiGii toxin family protein [Chlamydiales bacterium]|nr:nucleotidyl transferase AbiEii/AbiGii toxin family protein [Chlamydiales bacterium]
MNRLILDMLAKYECKTMNDHNNALKEIIQEVALLGLWRSKFFEKCAFYGGTALRILYNLDRFSEDLDFSLLKPTPDFHLDSYLSALQTELMNFGFNATVDIKTKIQDSAIQSAFIKMGTLEHLIKINIEDELRHACHSNAQLKIKLEVDTDPPPGNYATQQHFLLQPISFPVHVFSKPDLFAGKMHALLCRSWKTRIKGRDWYDFVWYVKNGIPINLQHLEARMRQSAHYTQREALTSDIFLTILKQKIENLDVDNAIEDICMFVKDMSSLEIWSRSFFFSVADKVTFV